MKIDILKKIIKEELQQIMQKANPMHFEGQCAEGMYMTAEGHCMEVHGNMMHSANEGHCAEGYVMTNEGHCMELDMYSEQQANMMPQDTQRGRVRAGITKPVMHQTHQ